MIDRQEYRLRAREFAVRGEELPQSKLCNESIVYIRNAKLLRDQLRRNISDTLSNEALAIKYNVTVRTIERILSNEIWVHV